MSLEEVHVFISPPPGVTAKMIDCKIMSTQLTLGIKGNPPFIDEPFAEFINAAESYCTWEDAEAPREGKELHLCITKGSKGVTWESLLKGHEPVDPFTQSEVQKSLMLERFQAENPGFDFSGASFNGTVPDAKNFMGGATPSLDRARGLALSPGRLARPLLCACSRVAVSSHTHRAHRRRLQYRVMALRWWSWKE